MFAPIAYSEPPHTAQSGHHFSRAGRFGGAEGNLARGERFLRSPGTRTYVTNAPRQGRGEFPAPPAAAGAREVRIVIPILSGGALRSPPAKLLSPRWGGMLCEINLLEPGRGFPEALLGTVPKATRPFELHRRDSSWHSARTPGKNNVSYPTQIHLQSRTSVKMCSYQQRSDFGA